LPLAAVVHCGDLQEWRQAVQILLFTALAVVLYLVADRALNALEVRAGRRFEHRSLIFFAILLALAIAVFSAVQRFAPAG
jgi:uncharacterized membrane protein YgdD (TMEM256/DUF423 family)